MSVMTRSRKTLAGLALVGAGTLVLAGCGGGTGGEPTGGGETSESASAPVEARDLTLKIGTILPQSGALSFLGPPEEAGVGLAVEHINAVSETTGLTIPDVVWGDSGDPANNAWQTTAPRLISEGVSAVIGAASSGVTKLFLDDMVAAGIITFSPANTSVDFIEWDDKDLYWRTAPNDLLQGEVLGNVVAEDGHSNVATIYLNDSYGTGLNKVFTEVFESTGGKVVASQSYNAGDTTFDAQISAVMASNPDAIVLITFDEVFTIAPALINAGFDGGDFYFVDGNLKQFGEDASWPAGLSLEGAKGTTPAGPAADEAFQKEASDWWAANGGNGTGLTEYSYLNESYDAVVLLALASLAANSTDPADIITKLREVSGGEGSGEKCTSYEECAEIILGGGVADYDGFSGPITFDEVGDPTEAVVGVFEYGADNTFTRIDLG
ncbi:ABC transporter substrate-binding protein [Microbacterium sp. No. 7]|uniref:ABC transporter substrate-binding protein n=1 Tax=Microbacterium sp. No. 7 TaxID=1714373 RepID=UPI0006D2679B|nr:ABC transporter substrate-binding protein [Microbacterium sp. No. 7]ALJ19122.1 amino acid ABC transporter substrate-binding protein [Microbacterium sp. No. 7]